MINQELYNQECEALKKLIKDFGGWPKGWPQRGQLLDSTNYFLRGIGVTVIGIDPFCVALEATELNNPVIRRTDKETYYPFPCWSTVGMLIEWVGDELIRFTHFKNGVWEVWSGANCYSGETLTLALCAAVESKMKVEAGHGT